MIAEALKYLSELAQSAARPVEINVPDPRRARYLTGGGASHEIARPVPPRDHGVKRLSDLIALAERFNSGPQDHAPVVWYDEESVVLVIDDDGHRCETATLDLVESDAFAVVRSLAGGTQSRPFDHKSFVRLLRIDLAGALAPSELLNVVRKIRFENGTITQGQVQKSRESLGREITAAVSAEAEIPDDVTLSVPVYKTDGEDGEYPLRCTVEVDPMQGCFRLIPYPDEIERVQRLAVASIAGRLEAGLPGSVPHHFGTPAR